MNLMELFVKIGVDDQASSKVSTITGKIGGGLKTAANIGAKAITAASGVIVGLTGLAIKNYAEYEQLVGGVETLFGASADRLMGYAEKAYMTAGMSANQYMEIATSFSASLLQSLGGDTKAAADYADMAMQDMADNANKMGTNIDVIQQTYQSLARGNFAMLDNLKLGYGGTKAEMERLVADAAKLDDSVKANDMSFGNLVKAIHVVQEEMGITGTTMKEASETITGSLMMTKAAWSNLVTGIADDNADFNQLIDNFVESAGIAADNLLPRIEVALTGVGKLIEELFPIIMDEIPTIITNTLPSILESAVSIVTAIGQGLLDNAELIFNTAVNLILMLADGLINGLPQMIPAVVNVLLKIVDTLTNPSNLVALINAALQIILALADGLMRALPKLIEKAPEIIMNLVTALIKATPLLLAAAFQMMRTIVKGIRQSLSSVVKAGVSIATSIGSGIKKGVSSAVAKAKALASRVVSAVKSGIGSVVSVGANLVEGLWNGVSNKIGWVTSKMASFGKSVINSLKSFFGIKSPSRLMRDEVGRYLAEGVVVGFIENDPMKEIERTMSRSVKAIAPSVSVNGSLGGGIAGGGVSVVQNIYSQAKTAADLMQEAIYQQEKAVYLGV